MARVAARFAAAWLIGTLIGYGLGAVAQSIFVLRELASMGAELSAGTWFTVIAHDLKGLAFGGKYVWYGANLAVAFLIAFPAAMAVARFIKLPLALVAGVAGAVGLVAMIEIINVNAPNTLFAGTRGLDGMAAQVVAGILAGLAFAAVIRRTESPAP